ncbi:hypothetical protein GCWU000246_00496 [Jonquetella anthropi E3_33 E1]|nr:hypothetical protein GCWU000246_00496 [Jonquetella anthropi E3_33 E1]
MPKQKELLPESAILKLFQVSFGLFLLHDLPRQKICREPESANCAVMHKHTTRFYDTFFYLKFKKPQEQTTLALLSLLG